MKKTVFISLLVLCVQIAFAQHIEVKSIDLLSGTESGGYYHPVFSPQGTYLLTTAENYAGLHRHSLTTDKKVETLTSDAGAGYGVSISPDEKTILFKKTEMKNNLRYTSLHQYSVADRKQTKIQDATREKLSPVFAGNKPAYVEGATLRKAAKTAEAVSSFINIEDRKMVLYSGASRTVLTPNGSDKSYFWASVSPDGQHIVYTVAAYGTYVCKIDGTNVVSLGKLNAPVWLNNAWVVGMNDIDDGDRVIGSEIVAASISGQLRQTLPTPQTSIAMYPAASADGTKIAFNSDEGRIYIMNIQFK